MEPFNLNHAQALYTRFCALYGDKFFKSYHDEEFKSIWCLEWTSGLKGIDVNCIRYALEQCKENLKWAPTIAEFREFCEKASGIPSVEDCLQSSIRGDFSHPITAMAYDKVGSWTMKNSKETELLPKFKAAYQEALSEFRRDPVEAKDKLKAFQDRRALPEPPPKIPTHAEIINWRERIKQYQEMAAADKLKLEAKDHPTWPKEQITRGHKRFDEAVFNERKRYLIGLDEIIAGTLSSDDWYDRTRYMREIEAMERLKNNTPPNHTQEEKVKPRASKGPYKAYHYWTN